MALLDVKIPALGESINSGILANGMSRTATS